MSAPLRIRAPKPRPLPFAKTGDRRLGGMGISSTASAKDKGGGDEQPDRVKDYLERLVKLIPAEVVGLYLAGKAAIETRFPPDAPPAPGEASYWIGWSLFCFVAVIAVRSWATRDSKKGLPTQWWAVGIAAVSFVIWVFSLGDVFSRALGITNSLLALLLVLAWTFVVPLIYQGSAEDDGGEAGDGDAA